MAAPVPLKLSGPAIAIAKSNIAAETQPSSEASFNTCAQACIADLVKHRGSEPG
jgi:hypothetical protein